MKYPLYLLGILLFSFNLNAQSPHDYINYMTDPTHSKEVGEGEPIKETREIDANFTEVIVGNGIQLFITPNQDENVKIVAQKNLLPLISSETDDDKLTVRLSASLETTKGIKLYVPINNISKINIKEGGYLSYSNDVIVNHLELLIQSGAEADTNINANNFSCMVMGGSVLNLEGKVSEKADIFVKGGSVLQGKKFECAECDMTVLGASKCKLKVTNTLNARVENESRLVYSGKPNTVEKTVKLNGKIRSSFLF